MRRGEWRGDLYRADLTGEELSEMTVGVIGYGEIGRRVVQSAQGFRLPHSGQPIPMSSSRPTICADGVDQVSLDRLLAKSDVGHLASARDAGDDEKLINAETLAQMKSGAILINTARGPLRRL